MSPLVAIVAPGNMGAAVARCLAGHSIEVITELEGRSAASAGRAAAAGMRAVRLEELTTAELILSILPPAAALPFARRLASPLSAVSRKPVFVDCNAVSPQTARLIGATITASGAPFVDAGIIGPPPRQGGTQPTFYASGSDAPRFAVLRAYGLDVRVLDGPVGAASGLKLCFAGINKGIIAVATAMTLAAQRMGAAAELREELARRQPELLASLGRKVPDMLPKAYRWVAEMQEISQVASAESAGGLYLGAADLYERIARSMSSDPSQLQALRDFFTADAASRERE